MKVRLLIIFLLLLFSPKIAFAQSGYTISKFDSKINILNSGEVNVSENIDVNFLEAHHGIYRDIPYVYQNKSGVKTYTEVNVESVLQDGERAQTQDTKNGSFLRIRIGNPNQTITGNHNYQITYNVKGVLTSQKSYDELYWNTTGNNWDVEIASSTAEISISQNAILAASCYEEAYSSAEKCNSSVSNSTLANFSSDRLLNPQEGMTVAVALKKGVFPIIKVARPKTFFENLFSLPSESTFLISLLAGIVAVFWLWYKFGRDYWTPGISGVLGGKNAQVMPIGANEPVVVEFTPPDNLTPALVGILVDERADTLDVTSTIIDLASRGFLTITEVPKKWLFGKTDYKLSQTSKDPSKLLSYEKSLLTKLFTKDEILLSSLKYTFYNDLATVKKLLYQEAIDRGYFFDNPETIRNKYFAISFGIIVFAGIIIALSSNSGIIYIFDICFAAIIVGIILLIFSQFMPRRTAKGRDLYRRIKGYKLFIETAEEYKQRFFENKNIFTDVLPYVIVFGLTEKFAKAMQNIGLKPDSPTWYHGVNAFNAVSFSNNINSFSSSLSSAIASTPSSGGSGGGGFSGGGFGGGGGGGW